MKGKSLKSTNIEEQTVKTRESKKKLIVVLTKIKE
jgi:hypothetical protein